ncbi:MAG: KUP/HAK/KT family potassium transporter [Planctomycetota bacterium]
MASDRNGGEAPEDGAGADGRTPLALLALAALGVVYGDIGTSPLYAVRECFTGEFGVAVTDRNVLGVLSLIFWALVAVVSTKYLGFVLRADNQGEGGVIALSALLGARSREVSRVRGFLLGIGVFAAALLYGDGMITPSISVLSAVEGLRALDPSFERYVLPITVVILTLLFAVQHKGTARIGAVFGPITLVWFVSIGALGLRGILVEPSVLAAVAPWHGARFLLENGSVGFLVLGAVFLVVTGAEALYADMGHFGLRPIRLAWWLVAMPGLLLSYFGQGALLLADPAAANDPFYRLAPSWALVPLLVLATVATIVASQAVISGTFSLTRQAIQLGYCPRLTVVQTSSTEIGQVYVPAVNWLLLVSTLALVIGFRSSTSLAAAYGVAVTTTMTITTLLFVRVARERFGWNRYQLGAVLVAFLVVDLAFLGANLSKILHGAWFPLVIGGAVFLVFQTWRRGRWILATEVGRNRPHVDDLIRTTLDVERVEGRAVHLTSDPDLAPASVLHALRHIGVLHETTVFLTLVTEPVPRVEREERVEVEDLGNGFHGVVGHFGYFESPNVPYVLALAREKGLDLPLEGTSFFLSRERIRIARKPHMAAWRERLFSFLSRNALGATAYFAIPPDQVVEIGTQVEM